MPTYTICVPEDTRQLAALKARKEGRKLGPVIAILLTAWVQGKIDLNKLTR